MVSSSPRSPRASRAIAGAESVGASSVVERERVVKSWSRTLSVTVRPDRPLLRSRSATLADCRVDQSLHQPLVGEVGVVGALDADRLGLAFGNDGAVVLRARQLVETVTVGLAEHADQLVLADSLEVGHGGDACAAQTLGGGRSDAGDHGHVHRAQQLLLGAGRDDHQPVGLVEVAGDLGDELGGADPDRRGQATGDVGGRRPRTCSARARTVASSYAGRPAGARSTNASSSESGSTSGESSRSTSITRRLDSR